MTRGPHLGLLLLLFCSLCGSKQTCPPLCLCLPDTISCSSGGLAKLPHSLPTLPITLDLSHNHISWLGPRSFNEMPRLENLWMGHNRIGTLEHDAFLNVSGLRLLDLSSNELRVVGRRSFQGLWRLKELHLYNNRIAQVEAGALSGLSSLEMVYFSLNRITHFSFFSIQGHSHPFLAVLDLSSNRLARLPWQDVKALPQLVQQGLYLHNNSLICDCSMYGVFWHWNLRNYSSVKDFLDEHTCNVNGDPRASVHFLRPNRPLLNCTLDGAVMQPVTALLSTVVVSEGDRVSLDCQTSLGGTDLSFTWLSLSKGFVTRASMNDTPFSTFSNGTLEIRAAKVSDSGLYRCTAVDVRKALNATREVNVTVLSPAAQPFDSSYTTLLACVVTLILILLYLFLTPCRCRSCRCLAATYIPRTTPSASLPSERDQPKADT